MIYYGRDIYEMPRLRVPGPRTPRTVGKGSGQHEQRDWNGTRTEWSKLAGPGAIYIGCQMYNIFQIPRHILGRQVGSMLYPTVQYTARWYFTSLSDATPV